MPQTATPRHVDAVLELGKRHGFTFGRRPLVLDLLAVLRKLDNVTSRLESMQAARRIADGTPWVDEDSSDGTQETKPQEQQP